MRVIAKVWDDCEEVFKQRDELLAACRMAQRYFDDMGPPLGESDASHQERQLRAQIQDAIANTIPA